MRGAVSLAALLCACGSADVTFSNLRVEELSATRALIRFETSAPTTCEVEYGLAENALDGRATDPDMAPGQLVTGHRVPLEDLRPATTYYWRARATDEDGRTFYSAPLSFETVAANGMDTGRNVSLISNGASIAEVSSNWAGAPNDGSFGANLAIDGKMATEWSSNGDGNDAFIVIALERPQSITRIAFRSREMTDGTSIIRKISVKADDQTMLGPFDTPDPSQRYVFEFTQPVTAQRWRIEAVDTSGGNTGAREIELWTADPP